MNSLETLDKTLVFYYGRPTPHSHIIECLIIIAFSFASMEPDCTQLSDSSNIKAAMACCHSLTYIEGEISGDPLDVKMYEATGWELEEVGEETNRYDIIMPTVVKPKVCLQIYMDYFFF